MPAPEKLNRVLRNLVELLEEEANCNPAFAARLERITAELPENARHGASRKPRSSQTASAPDVFAALEERGEEEFRFWLRGLDIPTLKSVIKANGFDPAKVSVRWSDSDKFVALVAEQTIARMKRGSAFLPPPHEPR